MKLFNNNYVIPKQNICCFEIGSIVARANLSKVENGTIVSFLTDKGDRFYCLAIKLI